jgi:hypothetical protein
MSALAGLLTSLLLASAVCGGDSTETEGPTSKKRKALSYVCPDCQQGFRSSTGLSNHYRERPGHAPEAAQIREVHKRVSFTYHDKLEIVSELYDARSRGVRSALKTIAKQYGVKPSTLRNWY